MAAVKRRVLVVINPSSADFEADRRWPSLEPILSRIADISVLKTDPDDARTMHMIKSALAAKADRVIAIGGDGTAHLVLNAMLAGEREPEDFAVIPFGTSNDVAKSLQLPLGNLERMAEIAVSDQMGLLDV